jgi:hypothetical protein
MADGADERQRRNPMDAPALQIRFFLQHLQRDAAVVQNDTRPCGHGDPPNFSLFLLRNAANSRLEAASTAAISFQLHQGSGLARDNEAIHGGKEDEKRAFSVVCRASA